MTLKLNGTNSEAAPAYAGDDADTGLQCGTNELKLVTGGTARATVDSSGRLLVGTTTAGSGDADDLTISNSGQAGITIRSGSSNAAAIYFSDGTSGSQNYQGIVQYNHSTEKLEFYANYAGSSNARMIIDSSGRLLVGTSTARSNFFAAVASAVQVEGNDTATSTISVVRNSNNADGPTVLLGRSRGTGNTIVQNGDRIGRIEFQANDGTNFLSSANIQAFVDGTPGTSDMPTRLTFSTCADGASSPTERLRITSDGTIKLASGCPGIDFSQIQTNASGMTSETLDSYEEGNWSPQFANSSKSTANISSQPAGLHGRYTKIGNRVFFNCWINGDLSTTETTSAIRIINLPFSANSDGSAYSALSVWNYGGFSTYKDEFYARNQNGDNQIVLQRYGADLTFNDIVKTGINMMISGHYSV